MLLNRLRELRADRGYKQIDIANILKISREAYSLYESGRRQINPESMCMLADFYSVSVDYLLGRKDVDIESLKDDETALLMKYRELDERGKENVCNIVDLEYSRIPESKKGSKSSAM